MSEAPALAPTPALSKNELLKQRDPTLAGDIAATLANDEALRFSDDDEQFIKFHGFYQQDDRDKRKAGKEYIFMVRNRLPGGVVSPEQYLVFDDLATRYGNNTLRITSRQAFQWHGVVKQGLGPLLKRINDVLSTTLAACGDVARNVMAPSTPSTSALTDEVLADAALVSRDLLPRSTAYHQIWVDGNEVKLGSEAAAPAEDPLYGRQYLPRKFKTAFAIPPLNDVDIFTNCLGFVAIADPANPVRVLGYNLLAGGGMGMSHGNKETYPRVADVLGFFPRARLVDVAKAVLIAYRDHGDRTNRKHARLKYVLEEKGAAWFREQVEQRAGFRLEEARPMYFTQQGDRFGWHRQSDGRIFIGLYIEAGRVKDTPARQLKTALRRIVEKHRVEVRLTPSQNLLLANVPEAARDDITALLAEHGIPVENQTSAVRRASMACPSMPTCGLGLAESERALPGILDDFERELTALGLSDEEIIIRMTGCPNGCARPYMAEIGFVGRAPNKYNVYFGGDEASLALNREYRASVKREDLMKEIAPILRRWRDERRPGERFGAFANRVVFPEQAAAAVAMATPATPAT
ncbi:MAG: NADPH-dependent assimilatory sulfite reductase hemoprotein subunit [Candidatus Didemnitutus sp.]|nr:NADPH-dependent assimilatory sulfite reductase hemoprotein subunit [Candidatus Didemnitutus sp.]